MVPCAAHRAAFTAAGYRVEATVPGLYRGREDGDFLGLFLDPARALPGPAVAGTPPGIEARAAAARPAATPDGVELRACGPADAEAMAIPGAGTRHQATRAKTGRYASNLSL